jgi:hypothetical protein
MSLEGIDARLKQVRANINLMKGAALAAGARLRKEAALTQAEIKDSKDNFVDATGGGDEDAAKKSADAAAARAERLAERQRDIADRAAQEILDIEKALSDARLAAEIGTQDQIDANMMENLSIIDTETRKRKLALEGLLRDAQNAGSGTGVENATKAISMLPALQAQQEAQVRREAVVASIELREKNINTLIAERDAKIEQINTLVELGIKSEVDGRNEVNALMGDYKTRIVDAIIALQAQLEALKASNPDLAAALHVDELIAKLETSKVKAGEVAGTIELIGKHLGGEFATGVANATGELIKGLTGGVEGVNSLGEAFAHAGNAFLDFLATFLVGIGQAILQAILLKAIMNAITGGTGGYTDAALGALTGHTGGKVGTKGGIGRGNPMRRVSAAIFNNADKYHSGGVVGGLKRDEVPAILKKGERVLTEEQDAALQSGGTSTGGSLDVTVVNQVDSEGVVVAGLGKARGKKAIYNVIAADTPAFRKLLGIK